MMKKIIIVMAMLFASSEAYAATDAQRMATGFLFPIFVNGTGTNQANASGVYVNQTQFTAAAATTQRRSLLGVGK